MAAAAARDAYLTTQVMTATPQKLQLMLIDAAIRSAQQAGRHWQAGNEDAAGEALQHAQEVVSEMLASVGSARSEVSRRLAGIYLFLFRTLTEAHLQRDERKLADALRILLIERETWSQVCEKFGATMEADQHAPAVELNAPAAAIHRQDAPVVEPTRETPTGFDSSKLGASPTLPPRRAAPIAFPQHDAPATGISFQA